MTQYLSFNGYVLNGTSRKIRQHVHRTFALSNSHPGGISPIIPTFDNWTRVEAIQQGLTAEVNCKATPTDPNIRTQQSVVAHGIIEVSLCCNCSSGSTDSDGACWPLLVRIFASTDPLLIHVSDYPPLVYGDRREPYLAFTKCPLGNADNVISTTFIILLCLIIYSPNIAVYLNSGHYPGKNGDSGIVGNQTCIIKPRWLNVNAIYVRDGFLTLEPMTRNLPDIPLTSSLFIRSAISTLEDHFANSQTMLENHIADTIELIRATLAPGADDAGVKEFVSQATVKHTLRHSS